MKRAAIGQAIFESVLVLAGIVLGFLVNEWREERNAIAEAERAVERVVAEIEINKERVERIRPYHAKLANGLAKAVADPASFEGQTMVEFFFNQIADKGIGDLILQDEAWKTALAQDALGSAEFETLEWLAATYEIAGSGPESSWQSIIRQIDEQASFTPEETHASLLRLAMKYQNLVSQEDFLLRQYSMALKAVAPEKYREEKSEQ